MTQPKHHATDFPEPGKIAAVGTRHFERNAFDPGPLRTGDKLTGEWRDCARCGRRFEKSLKRRVLCAPCFGRASGGDEAA